MVADPCRVSTVLKNALEALKDIEKDLLEEKRVQDERINKISVLHAGMFPPDIQLKLDEVSEFLVEYGVEDVGIGAIMSKIGIQFVQKIKEMKRRNDLNTLLKKFNKYVSLLHEIENQLINALRYSRYEVSISKQDPGHEEVIPPLCMNMEEISLSFGARRSEFDELTKKKKELQEQLDVYNGVPADLKSAEAQLLVLKAESKKLMAKNKETD